MTPIWIILLRGINVGGRGKLPMKELVRVLESQGFEKVKTYIQSGNAVARTTMDVPRDIDERIADVIESRFRFRPHVLVLSADDLQRAITSNPFPEAEADPRTHHVFFLASNPTSPDMDSIDRVHAPSERYHLEGQFFYMHAPEGFGRSKLAASAERYLGVPATARNWRTVMKLRAMSTEV